MACGCVKLVLACAATANRYDKNIGNNRPRDKNRDLVVRHIWNRGRPQGTGRPEPGNFNRDDLTVIEKICLHFSFLILGLGF